MPNHRMKLKTSWGKEDRQQMEFEALYDPDNGYPILFIRQTSTYTPGGFVCLNIDDIANLRTFLTLI